MFQGLVNISQHCKPEKEIVREYNEGTIIIIPKGTSQPRRNRKNERTSWPGSGITRVGKERRSSQHTKYSPTLKVHFSDHSHLTENNGRNVIVQGSLPYLSKSSVNLQILTTETAALFKFAVHSSHLMLPLHLLATTWLLSLREMNGK